MRFCLTGLLTLALSACDPKTDAPTDTPDPDIEDQVPDTVTPPEDSDGDGYAVEDDCDDSNAAIHPGQQEVCDGVDDNCNGVIDEGFSDTDTDGTADCIDAEECDGLDNNGDGLIDESFADSDGDGVADCIDAEECNGIDDDGDGDIDEDFDLDGDGYAPCGGTLLDCDDTDADINPDAEEDDSDGLDNDCDGVTDEGLWAEGDLVITEVFNNPIEVNDTLGEWFEIRNTSGEDRMLNGLHIVDDGGDYHQITDEDPLWLSAGAYMVLGNNGESSTNGGFSIDYTYSGVTLSNESDSLILEVDGILIDAIAWDDGGSMPDVSGSSMSLDPLFIDASKNDLPQVWCDTAWPDIYTAPQLSTPGEDNGLCASYDHDGDGYAMSEGDCDDTLADVGPGSAEVPYDSLDNDCDSTTPDDDIDGDGFLLADDCDDADAAAFPGADEVCDGLDNDCDGATDDDDSDVLDAYRWYPDADGDGFGDAGASWIETCAVLSGYVEDHTDCDDTNSGYNPGIIEDDCDDPEDYNCDGQVAFVDEDLDGFSACDDDCDDFDARLFPYAWEDTTDGIDNDCDGDIDSDDTDTVRTLNLGDDDFSRIALSASFPFCSTDWTDAYVSSNGRLTFSAGSTSYSYSSAALASSMSIAGLWDDLNPSSRGQVATINYADATGVYFIDVSEYGTSSTVTFSMIMLDDGRIVLSYGDIGTYDGLAGWSCGTSTSATESDLTDEAADVPANSLGIGQGTEESFHELFTSTADASDLAGQTFTFCVNSGSDDDGDGWTDQCGDSDDTDSTATP